MMTTPSTAARESCEACGFDSDLYNRSDTITSQHVIPAVLAAAIEGLDADALGTRPADDVCSIAEYLDHVREVGFGNRFAIETALADPGHDLGAAPKPAFNVEAAVVDVEAALAAVDVEFRAIGSLLGDLSDDAWSAQVHLDGSAIPVDWFARHVLHDALHHLGDIGRIRHRLGHGAPTQSGSVVQLNVSGGGVPKRPVSSARIDASGVGGDTQSDRRHHGRPVQAVCLWSADVIAALQEEAHPIAAGNAGENVTIDGVDWASLRPGSRIDVGEVPMLLSAHAIPCAKNAQWFHDLDFNRILHDRHPGWSRLYAIPLGAGTVRPGDSVTVEP